MTERDGRYDANGFDDDTDWLMSQLGSGRRPDLEGRQATQPPVAPAPEPPRAEPAPQSRPRRRSEESLDWFSVAEPAPVDDAPTRALPVVGEPIERTAPAPAEPPAAPAWNQPSWNAPAWSSAPAEPPADDRLTSVEPPVGGTVPPAFTRQPEPPPAPPGPVTPPANFALTWGEQQEQQPLDTEEGLRAAFRRLADPSNTPPARQPDPNSGPGPEQYGDESPFAGFAPPPVARRSFTPVSPSAAPGAPDDFAEELWSALHEDDQPAGTEQESVGHDLDGYADQQAFDDRAAYAEQGAYAEQRAYEQGGHDRGGYEQGGYAPGWTDGAGFADPVGPGEAVGTGSAGVGPAGYVQDFAARGGGHDGDAGRGGDRGYGDGFDRQGFDRQGYDRDGYDQDGYDRDGYDRQGYARQAYDAPAYDENGGYDGRAYGYDEGGDANGPLDEDGFGPDAYADTGAFGEEQFGAHDEASAHDDGYDLRELWRQGGGAQSDGTWSDEPTDWREDVGRPAADPADDVRWYADDLDDRRGGPASDRPSADAPSGDDPWNADESPRAREFAQAGFLWNLTPDPAGRDPKVPTEEAADDEQAPGPRRGAGAPVAADDPGDDPFGLGARDERAADAGRPAFDDPWAAYDVDERTTEVQGRPGTEADGTRDDGLAALFGGAGFGATGPMSVVDASAVETEYDRPHARETGYGYGAVADDPFARDERGGWDDSGDARAARPRAGDDDRGGYRATPAARTDDAGRDRSPVRILTWAAGALALVVLIVAVVAFGTRFLAPGDAGTAAPVATEEPVAAPTAPQPAGVHSWQALYGTECLEPFDSAWAEEFTVVDCASPHTAQLAYRGTFAGDEATEFPGEEALATQSQELCAAEGVIDPAAAGGVGELQMLTAFPVTAEQWDAGQRSYYCFVEQVSGEPLTVSLAGAGPAAP
ncbi:septum formation family protein [Agromyces kandeliae]|uniref:Septum formation-related domain-containing protein n=1 Tax=Agromyces kandeliae TaxID=2666141 RepID=A0A6L5R0M9_9MICO|nr:hypothetical protein [Agromyces kandeliae]MRX43519.1 hypothetical protein [Agromyces kandeliae]